MSLQLMVRVMQEIEVTRPQQGILLAMAEHANDDGTSCFPSIDRIAWKAGYKPRAVEAIIRQLKKDGILVKVAEPKAHRPAEYEIHLEEAPKKQPFEEWKKEHGKHKDKERGAKNAPVHSQVLGVHSHSFSVSENAPEPSTIEPSIEPSESPPEKNGKLSYLNNGTRQLVHTLMSIERWDKNEAQTLELVSVSKDSFPQVDLAHVATSLSYKIRTGVVQIKKPSRAFPKWVSYAAERVKASPPERPRIRAEER